MNWKKYGMNVLFAGGLTAFGIGFWHVMNASNAPTAKPIPRVEGKIAAPVKVQRNDSQTIDLWVANMDTVARISNVPEALRLMEALKKGLIKAKPAIHQGNAAAEMGPEFKTKSESKEPWVAFLVLEDNIAQGKEWQKVLNPNTIAQYDEEQNCMMLRSTDLYSPAFRGLIGLHEAFHWMQNFTGQSEGLNDPNAPSGYSISMLAAHEGDAFLFETKLAELIGGPKYIKLLDEYKGMVAEGIEMQSDTVVNLPTQPPYDGRLDEVFGPSYSAKEQITRMSIFHINGINRYFLGRYPGKEPYKHIIETMGLIYNRERIHWPG